MARTNATHACSWLSHLALRRRGLQTHFAFTVTRDNRQGCSLVGALMVMGCPPRMWGDRLIFFSLTSVSQSSCLLKFFYGSVVLLLLVMPSPSHPWSV